MRVLALAMVAACYSPPRDAACTIACESTAECPSGLACVAGRCGSCDVTGDGGSDGDDSSPDTRVCAGVPGGLLPGTCFDPVPQPQMLGNIDTDMGPCDRVVAGTPELCIVVTREVTSDSIVTGSRVLVLWSPDMLTVTGTIDAASRTAKAPNTGPASGIACTIVTPAANAGAAGGSFGAMGGNGGTSGSGPGAGGMPGPTLSNTMLRGGCSGGLSNNGAQGGLGGGAVYLMAHGTLTISGVVNASGAGGHAGPLDGGGGGGGAGGFIGFDADMIFIETSATIMAIGGGGGSGGEAVVTGTPGDDPTAVPFHEAAVAGAPGNAGSGGRGGATGFGDDGGFASGSAGGGGGGGGTGIIRVFASNLPTISAMVLFPTPTN